MNFKTKVCSTLTKYSEFPRRVLGTCLYFIHVLWALLVLFVEWGWHPLSEFLAALTRFVWIARLEKKIERLSPYPALFLFLLPLGFLVPIKIFALWMVMHGEVFAALALVLFAKLLTTAFVARTFKLTRDKILSITWFAGFYHRFVSWKHHLFEILRTSLLWQFSRQLKGTLQAWRLEVLTWVKVHL